MKKEKLIAVGLAATLALGAMPALAFGATDSTTNVKVTTTANNISVDMPVGGIPITALTGGGDATVPSDCAIVNKSTIGVQVSKLKVEVLAADTWKLTDSAQTSVSVKPADAKMGSLFMTLQPLNHKVDTATKGTLVNFSTVAGGANSEVVLSDWTLKPAGSKFQENSKDVAADKLIFAGTDKAEAAYKGILASTSQLGGTYDTSTDVVKLTFTVAPATIA